MAEKDTMKVRILTLIIISMLATPLLADNYDDTLKRCESFVESNPLGSSSDFLAGEKYHSWVAKSDFGFWLWRSLLCLQQYFKSARSQI